MKLCDYSKHKLISMHKLHLIDPKDFVKVEREIVAEKQQTG